MAVSLEELWKIVDTSEATQKHCMMMENVNYGRDELMFLNMVRQGMIGDLLHGEASYIHCLVTQLGDTRGEGAWRPEYHTRINGNLYPTHGLGPVAQYMSLARKDDNFSRLRRLPPRLWGVRPTPKSIFLPTTAGTARPLCAET